MQGVPWTKAWGMMFLVSFLVFETMVFRRRKDRYTILAEDSPLERRARHHLENFNLMDHNIFKIGIVFHSALVLWAIVDIWSLRGRHYHDVYSRHSGPDLVRELEWPASLMPPAAALGALIAVSGGVFTLVLFYISWMSISYGLSSNGSWRRTAVGISFWMFISFSTLFIFVMAGLNVAPTGYLIDLPILVVLVGVVPLAMLVLSWLCEKFPGLGKKLLVRSTETTGKRIFGSLELSDLSNLMFFLVNIAACAAWYWLKYDPEGTVNPGWTGIFG